LYWQIFYFEMQAAKCRIFVSFLAFNDLSISKFVILQYFYLITYLRIMNFKNLLWALAVSATVQVSAQQFAPCATDEYMEQLRHKHEPAFRFEQDFNESISMLQQVQSITQQSKRSKVLYVPVVFHIMHNGGTENISQAQIMNQMRIINEDFRKVAGTNGFSNDPLAVDMEIEFRLAQYDPNGNKHDGINRVRNVNTVNASDFIKSLSYWDARRYLNVWVVNSIQASAGTQGTILGYAQFPTMLSFSPNTDGIVIRADQVGTIGIGSPSQAGRTLTHEIGHWLNLFHPFQGGCGSSVITTTNCGSTGDQVCDTPPVREANFGCNTNANSCSNDVPDLNDLIRNYMDYSNGTCMNMFTIGQKTRVNASLRLRTGIFGAEPNFNQNISYAGINATDGSYIPVPASAIKAPYFYSFEAPSLVIDGWRLNNFNNPDNGFAVRNNAAFGGERSISMLNFNNPNALINGRDGFQTPEIDLTTVSNPHLEFYYAYAQRSDANNDLLAINISNTFGMQENLIFNQAGPQMATAPVTSSSFIPTRSEWRKVSINLNQFKEFNNARFRFEFTNRRGNNIYFDNIAITDGPTTSLTEAFKSAIQFELYPNPAKENIHMHFTLNQSTHLQITIRDILGKEVISIANEQFGATNHQITVQTNNLKSGMYFVEVVGEHQSFSHKLLIN
jgi:hypothetical protein